MAKLDSAVEQRNSLHLVMDIAWFGFASAATIRFLPYFAIRLSATPLEVGLITSLPAIVLFLVNWLSGWWHQRYTNSVQAMLGPSILHRMAFLLPVFAPVFPSEWRPLWIILAATLPAVGQAIASTIFIIIMREAVRKEHLTRLMTRRKLWMNVAIGVSTVLSGFLLEALPFPLNYQIVFTMAAAVSGISFWHLKQVQVESRKPRVSASPINLARQQISSPQTSSVAYMTLTAFISFYFIVGVIPVHLASLGATEGFIAIFGVVELLAAAASTLLIVRLVHFFGNRTLVAISVMVTAAAAVILGFTVNVWITLIAAAITGTAWTIADVGMFGYFTERTATENMGATIVYNEVMYIGIFIGPLLGNSLLEFGMSTASVLIIGAGLRLIGGMLIRLLTSSENASRRFQSGID